VKQILFLVLALWCSWTIIRVIAGMMDISDCDSRREVVLHVIVFSVGTLLLVGLDALFIGQLQ